MRKLSSRGNTDTFLRYAKLSKEAKGLPKWIYDRAQYILKCNPGLKEEVAYGLAGQQYHLTKKPSQLNSYEIDKYNWPKNRGKYEDKASGTGDQFKKKLQTRKNKKKKKEKVKKKIEEVAKTKKTSGRILSKRANKMYNL